MDFPIWLEILIALAIATGSPLLVRRLGIATPRLLRARPDRGRHRAGGAPLPVS